jgi:hypothetical protein
MPRRTQPSDPIADYIEWTEHRYDPGYYLGGRIPPHLKKATLGPKGRRNGGILLLVAGTVASSELFWSREDVWIRIVSAVPPALFIFAGLVMLVSANAKGDSKVKSG